MKKERQSLKNTFIFSCIFLVVSLSLLIGYNNYGAIQIIRVQTLATIQDTTLVQRSRIIDNLTSIEAYLTTFVYDDNYINILENNPTNTQKWFSALHNMQKKFNSSTSIYSADDFFLYLSNSNAFITSNSGISRELHSEIDSIITENLFQNRDNQGNWMCIKNSDNQYYLVRIIRVSNSYIGGVVYIDSLIDPLQEKDSSDLHFNIANAEGLLLHSNSSISTLEPITNTLNNNFTLVTINNETNLLVKHSIPNTHLSLVVLSPDVASQTIATYYNNVLFIVLAGLILLLLIWFYCMYQWILVPITSLTHAIHRLKSGDMTVSVDQCSYCKEFNEMNTAFNEMIKEIQNLKINVYEEQLQHKNTEIEYLKLQVTPHFLINCLNTVYQLTEANQPELTLAMIKKLTLHLRYMLNSGSSVSLAKEVELVHNFVDLSSIRYPGCIRLQTHYNPAALKGTAIPLLILNFVENTIKYEVEMGKIIEILIDIEKIELPFPQIKICILDTGRGFSKAVLDSLQDINTFIINNKSQHIGIANIFQRANLILGESSHFSFSNCEYAGAKIEIMIPFIPFNGKEN